MPSPNSDTHIVELQPIVDWAKDMIGPRLSYNGFNGKPSGPRSAPAFFSSIETPWTKLRVALDADADTAVILFLRDLRLMLARRLSDGKDVQDAIEKWRDNAQSTLSQAAAYPDRVWIYNADRALSDPDGFLTWCEEPLGKAKRKTPPPQLGRASLPTDLSFALAELVILRQPGLASLQARLPLSGTMIGPTFDDHALLRLVATHQTASAPPARPSSPPPQVVHAPSPPTLQRQAQKTSKEPQFRRHLEQVQAAAEAEFLGRLRAEQTIQSLEGQLQRQGSLQKEQIARLEEALAHKSSELTGLQSHIFWRATSPIRKVLRRLSKVPGLGGSRDAAIIRNSGLFDKQWYLKKYPDVEAAGVDPALHYLNCGHIEGREPGPKFSGRRYLRDHPDVAETGANPLLHYLSYGRQEGRGFGPVETHSTTKTGA